MLDLIHILNKKIGIYQETQGNKKRKIDIENFEQEIIKILGSHEIYNSHGGYKKFCECISNLEALHIISPLTSCKNTNGKNPSLRKFWWIEPKYTTNQWTLDIIARLSTHLNISFYVHNKKYQTPEELRKLECIYKYLKNTTCDFTLIREERSLLIFNEISSNLNHEPEKFLSSDEGKTLLNRLNLSYEDLNCEVVREPFDFWISSDTPINKMSEVLIIEGLATYHTLKNMLKKNLHWELGPKPHILIWGAGRKIEGTIDYLYDIVPQPEKLNIRYAGDIDSEGLDIFYNLKTKNKHLNIRIATDFYNFLTSLGMGYSKYIFTNQRKIDSVLHEIEPEFLEYPAAFSIIQFLWFNKMRIPQEFINLETLTKEGLLHNA
ncbi:hypothetical protein D9O40_18300 [Clostridium autoethanogenum]|uniref:Wadjet protein JetD C-terminal domain-containing protein n=1 Tax=Clostridium autoethanogenum TaxID=84023 RepID=A0A3M0S631_9CLOT|nr:Wadjet anti-phage system protein JetD domain-containing protein [Clostridium autoethanogenum]RMC93030.1 hypothetical protein D9O40_18300 [Clostridium autoethanogenum]